MCAAISLKMRDRSISVAILEQMSRVGKKLITTGNGRCNITNRDIRLERFHGEDVSFAQFALSEYDNLCVSDFFAEIGVVFTYDETGRAYPYSLQASSVVDAMRFSLDSLGVETLTDIKVDTYRASHGGYTVSTAKGEFWCEALIIAAGLYSGGEKLGSDGSMLKILKSAGYKTVKTTPAIVQVRTKTDIVKSLKGIKVNAAATLFVGERAVRQEFGEVLFCDYGLSGPAVMQISRAVERTNGDKKITLDLMPEYSFQNVCDMINFRVSALMDRNLDEFFTGMLNKRVGQTVIKLCGLKMSDSVSSVTAADVKKMASVIKGMSFEVTGTTGFINSQVTAGGLDVAQFDSTTMMSKREKGLYCIGEILDIDGDCGGFNLQWAWSSAMCAADAVYRYFV